MRKYIFGFLALFCVGALFLNFKPTDAPQTVSEAEYFAPPTTLPYTWSLDTISNANNDTLDLPWVLQSRYTQAYQITRTSISGTANVAVSIQANVAYRDSTDPVWVTVATTSGTGATNELLTLAESYGQRYRIIVDGTGTQSTSYRISFLGKRLPN